MNMKQSVEYDENSGFNEKVLNRRHIYIFWTKRELAWLFLIVFFSMIISFSIILLPALSKSWRAIIESLPVIKWVSDLLSGAVFPMMVLTLVALPRHVFNRMINNHYPGGWDPVKQGRFPTQDEVIKKNLYPRTNKEEFVFWFYFFHESVLLFIGPIGLISGLAYMIKSGGRVP